MKKIIWLGICLLLAGCYTYQKGVSQQGRSFVERYPKHLSAIEEAVKAKRVICGMTRNEVMSAWGNPSVTKEVEVGGTSYEQWVYENRNRVPGLDTLYFRNGVLVFWED